jgi:hypothetical protein
MVSNKNTGGIRYLYPSLQQDDYNNLNIPSQEIYLLVLKKHSDIENLKINTKKSILGYLGKYQFGNDSKICRNIRYFIPRSPKMQERAFVALLSKNKWILQDIIKNTMVRWLVVS